MTTAVLLQEGQDDAQGNPVRILSVDSKVTGISLSRAAEAEKPDKNQGFDFSVDLDEQARTGDTLRIRYSLMFGKHGDTQVCRVDGEADVRFSHFDRQTDMRMLGDDLTNEMVVEIFRRSYEPIYLLHHSLGVEAPSPWITRDVSLTSGRAGP